MTLNQKVFNLIVRHNGVVLPSWGTWEGSPLLWWGCSLLVTTLRVTWFPNPIRSMPFCCTKHFKRHRQLCWKGITWALLVSGWTFWYVLHFPSEKPCTAMSCTAMSCMVLSIEPMGSTSFCWPHCSKSTEGAVASNGLVRA